MSQILRIHSTSVTLLTRFCSFKRQETYYDVLRVSPSSTRSEIRQAFIKLSKEMHPDTSGKKDHRDFVKVNEAYNVLSKESTRRDYDMTLRRSRTANHTKRGAHSYQNPYEQFYTSHREWEMRMAGGSRRSADEYQKWKEPRHAVPVSWIYGFIVIGIILQIVFLQQSLTFKRDNLWAQSGEYAKKYKTVRTVADSLSSDKQVEAFKTRVERRSKADDDGS